MRLRRSEKKRSRFCNMNSRCDPCPLAAEVADETVDLREFIGLLASTGRLARVTRPVDWKYELGQVTRETRTPLLFENIKDYPGYRVFTNGLSDISCISSALGLDAQTNCRELVAELKSRAQFPLGPVFVETSPVLENVVLERAIDFLQFPIPHWNRQDAGRYLGTWHINVTKDLDTGKRNVGVYRMQVLGLNQATLSVSSKSHLAQHFAKAEREGRPLEMAVAIGVPESVMIAASASYPAGCDEYELAGALQRHPVALMHCQTVKLEVPTHSEIVIEGEIKPNVRVQDGPFLDYTGRTNTNPNALLFEARRLMFRNHPIFRGTAVGIAGGEDHQLFAVLSELGLLDFHGQRLRQFIQNHLLRKHCFRAFQWAGKIGGMVRNTLHA